MSVSGYRRKLCACTAPPSQHHFLLSPFPRSFQLQHNSALLETILFPLVEEIRLGTAEVDDFWAAITVFFLNGAFLAVKCVGNPHTATNNAATFIRAIIALVADPHHCAGPVRRRALKGDWCGRWEGQRSRQGLQARIKSAEHGFCSVPTIRNSR